MQDIIPVRGTWDHTTASALAAPLIAGRLMGLNAEQLAHAAALSATHGNTLAVVRTGQLANSKANANAMVASQAVLCSLFAAEGMTGPLGVIEHRRGLSTGMLAGAKLDLLAQPIGDRYRIMDGRKLELKLAASDFVPPGELRTGSGTIQMEFSAIFGALAAGPHKLTIENRHLTAMSVYLINAAQPRFATVQITGQKRNPNQSAGEIEFTVYPFRPKTAVSAGQRPSYR